MFTLAVCAEMVYTELPFLERVERIRDRGFDVEMWDWTNKDLSALAKTGARVRSMTGYTTGNLLSGAEELLATAEKSIAAAKIIDCNHLNHHGTGLGEGGIPVVATETVTGAMWLQAEDTLHRLAELGARENVVFCLENLNTEVDHPGVPFAKAADTLALVAAVNSPNLRLNLDLYHAQIGEGNLIELLEQALPYIGEIQVADVPGRCEPGTGEINYPSIARALQRMGYTGLIAMEAFASTDSDLALDRFRDAFTV